MIQPLRTAHRSAFLILGISLPVLLVAGIASRKPTPPGPKPAEKESTIAQPIGELYFHSAGRRVSLQLNQIRDGSKSSGYFLSQAKPFPTPELLLYWSASNSSGSIPIDAIFIGQLVPGQKFSLPGGHEKSGNLLLYDAPHGRLLATFPLGKR